MANELELENVLVDKNHAAHVFARHTDLAEVSTVERCRSERVYAFVLVEMLVESVKAVTIVFIEPEVVVSGDDL